MWRQNWNDHFQTFISGEIHKENYLPSDSATTVMNEQLSTARFALGVQGKANSMFDYHASASLGHEVYYRALGLTTLTLDPVLVPEFATEIISHLVSLHQYELNAQVGGRLLLPTHSPNYTLLFGTGYDFGLSISETNFTGNRLECGARYVTYAQKTSTLDLSRKDVQVNCAYEWSW